MALQIKGRIVIDPFGYEKSDLGGEQIILPNKELQLSTFKLNDTANMDQRNSAEDQQEISRKYSLTPISCYTCHLTYMGLHCRRNLA
jgi:hypothetical protein